MQPLRTYKAPSSDSVFVKNHAFCSGKPMPPHSANIGKTCPIFWCENLMSTPLEAVRRIVHGVTEPEGWCSPDATKILAGYAVCFGNPRGTAEGGNTITQDHPGLSCCRSRSAGDSIQQPEILRAAFGLRTKQGFIPQRAVRIRQSPRNAGMKKRL